MGHSKSKSYDPVLIVGAGPTGLVLAIELARRDVPFHLIDRLAEPVSWSQAIFIKSRTLEILTGLGLRSRLYEHGQVVTGVNLYANELKVAAYEFDGLDTPFPHILSIPESEAIRILTEKLESLGGRVERGVEFVGLHEDGERVRVQLQSARNGEYRLDASWVVGTDGYHSAVRDAIGDAFDGKDYPELWGVFDTYLTNWSQPRDTVCAQLEAPIVIPFPLGEARWRIYFRTEKVTPEVLLHVEARLGVICPDVRLSEPQEPQFFHSHSRLAHDFRIGRVFLAGDAAHASNPIEGHGMNAGIQDAYNLGWKLAVIASGTATGELIESYQAERRPADRDIVQSGDDAYARMMPGGRDALRDLYDFLSAPEGRDFAAMAESEIGFSYAQSPIVEEVGETAEPPRPNTQIGCRVGDVAGLMHKGATVSLYELLAGPAPVGLVLLGAADGDAAVASLARLQSAIEGMPLRPDLYVVLRGAAPHGRPNGNLLLDPAGQLHERLDADEATLCIIRPDGHLGLCCRPPSAAVLKTHLARLNPAV